MRLFVVLIAVAACGTVEAPAPPWHDAQLEAAEVSPPPTAGPATALAMQLYADATGVAMPPVVVRWWDGEWIVWNGSTIDGVTFSCDEIWVGVSAGQRVSSTALAHELAHCAKAVAENGDSDPSHASPVWWHDGLVARAQAEIVDAGL